MDLSVRDLRQSKATIEYAPEVVQYLKHLQAIIAKHVRACNNDWPNEAEWKEC